MTIFKLERFPHVCRACLNPKSKAQMTNLTERSEKHGSRLVDLLDELTFPIPEEFTHLTPSAICGDCLEQMDHFLDYKKRLNYVLKFTFGMAQVKKGDMTTITELFTEDKDYITALLRELNVLESNNDLRLEDLLGEFPKYDINALTDVKKERREEDYNDDDYLEDTIVKVEVDDGGMTAEYLDEPPKVKRKCDRLRPLQRLKNGIPMQSKQKAKAPEKEEGYRSDGSAEKHSREELVEETVSKIQKAKPARKRREKGILRHCDKCSNESRIMKKEMSKHCCGATGCSEVFDSASELGMHRRANHATLICEICGFQTFIIKELVVHKQRHSNLTSYVCKYCQQKFNVASDLRSHIRHTHLAAMNHKCQTCGKEFKRKSLLIGHELSHGNEFNFHCKHCEKKFKTPQALRSHVAKVHTQPSHVCQYCDTTFQVRKNLYDHIERVHGVRVRFVCVICVNTFYSQEELNTHRQRHENPKQLECGTCLAVFESQEQSQNHMCFTYRDDYFCCGRDQRHHSLYNLHMFNKHGVQINARVRPDPDVLLGAMRAKRKRVESCTKCEEIFPTRTLKRQHMQTCVGKPV